MHMLAGWMCNNAPMQWDDARYLLALSRARNLSAAAEALRVSHTTVARRLMALQRGLEIRILERTSDGHRLTLAGRDLAVLAEQMEAAANGMARRLAGAEKRLAGSVRVTCTESLGSRLLAPGLAELAGRHPGLTVELLPDVRSLSLARREADIAVRLLRPREKSSLGKRVGRMSYAPYASVSYQTSVDGDRLLSYGERVRGSETDWLLRRYPAGRVSLRSPSTAALAAAAVAGAGIAVLPCFVGDRDPGLRRLAAPGDAPHSDIWLIVHRELRRSARIAASYELLAEILGRSAALLEGS